jgi:predicted nucleic acid-binding protein
VCLVCSNAIAAELAAVAGRPAVREKLGIPHGAVEQFVRLLRGTSVWLADVTAVYSHPQDPDDSEYINTALAAGARLVVSGDAHLLRRTDARSEIGRAFASQCPGLEVLTPPGLLERPRQHG